MTDVLTPLHFPRNYCGVVQHALKGSPESTTTWARYTTDCDRFSLEHNRLEKRWHVYAAATGTAKDTQRIWSAWLEHVGLDWQSQTFPTRRETLSALRQALVVDGLLDERNPASMLPESVLQTLVDDEWFVSMGALLTA